MVHLKFQVADVCGHLTCLLVLLGLTASSALLAPPSVAQTTISKQAGAARVKRQESAAAGRKCVPLLNIVLPQVNQRQDGSAGKKLLPRSTGSGASGSGGLPDSFTFPVNDIDMPLTQTVGPLQSAMRLLSSFDSSLDGLYGDAEPGAEQSAGQRDNSIRFTQNKLHISQLNLTMLNAHLYAAGQPKFALAVNIGNATLIGRFAYAGPTPSLLGAPELGSSLAGLYRMTIDNVLLTASANLTKRQSEAPAEGEASGAAKDELEAQRADRYRLLTNEFKMNISNLGYIQIEILDPRDSSRETPSYVLKMLQRVLQKTIKRTYANFEAYIRQTLEAEGRRFLDCELTRFAPILKENQEWRRPEAAVDLRGPGEDYLDDLARILSSEIRNSQLDQVALPNFEYQRGVLGTNALIQFSNGSLSGLDNLRLLGETKVKLQDEHLIVNASLGWFNLRPLYNWTLHLGTNGAQAARLQPADLSAHKAPLNLTTNSSSASALPSRPTAAGFVGAQIKAIEFDTLISRSLRQSQARVSVDELNIRRLDGPKLELGGLPGMNRLTRATVNFFMARLKQRLVASIQSSLKLELERALNRLAPASR